MAEQLTPGSPQDPKTKEILIVDDDEAMLNLLSILVKRDGFRIDLASTGDDALEEAEAPARRDDPRPHAPRHDQRLRRAPAPARLLRARCLPSSSSPPTRRRRRSRPSPKDPNVVQFLSKPINQKVLLGALHKVLKTVNPHPAT